MSNLQLTGKIVSGTATEKKTDTFSVRTFVLELTETNATGQVFTNLAQFQLVNNNCAVLDQFQPGQMVNVHFNVRGQAWNDKVITNLNAWKIELAQPMQQAALAQPQHAAPAPPPQQAWGAPAQQPQQPAWTPPSVPPSQQQPAPSQQPAWGAPQPQQFSQPDPNLPF